MMKTIKITNIPYTGICLLETEIPLCLLKTYMVGVSFANSRHSLYRHFRDPRAAVVTRLVRRDIINSTRLAAP